MFLNRGSMPKVWKHTHRHQTVAWEVYAKHWNQLTIVYSSGSQLSCLRISTLFVKVLSAARQSQLMCQTPLYTFTFTCVFTIKNHCTSHACYECEKSEFVVLSRFFLMTDKSCVFCEWHNMRLYLLFNMQKYQTNISDSVCAMNFRLQRGEN